MTWTGAAEAQSYGSTILEGDGVRFRALDDGDLPDLVRWWRDPEWAVLQQILVRPRPEARRSLRCSGVGARASAAARWALASLTAPRVSLLVTSRFFGAALPVRAATLAVMIGSEHVGRGYGPMRFVC